MSHDAPKPQQWFFSKDGAPQGPFTSRELRAAAASGRLSPDDLVRREGMATWAKASKVRGLFPPVAETHVPEPAPIEPVIPKEMMSVSLGESHRSSSRADVEADSGSPIFTPVDNETKACPYCGETILSVARKCKHCGEFLDDSQKKPGKAVFRASGDFIGLLCSYHIMDCNKTVLAKIKPHEAFHIDIQEDTVMYVYNSGGFEGPARAECHANTVNRFSVCPSQSLFGGCIVARVDIIDSD
jgi:hypothetical protein